MKKIKKVVLVLPNFRWTAYDVKTLWNIIPYSLCLLAAMVEKEYDVVIIDANMDDLSKEQFVTRIKEEKPDFVGISILMDQYGQNGHIAAELIKSVDQNIVVVLGGVYATMNHSAIIKDVNIDYVVVGEGEYTLKYLLGYLNNENKFPEKGVTYRKKEEVVICQRADFIVELDQLPLPAYHLIDFAKYANSIPRISVDALRVFPFARMFTSRGCPVGCSFCQVESIAGRKFRYRSAENVLEEMKWLKDIYGIKSIVFDDDNLITNKKRAKDIFQGMIDQKFNFTWNIISLAVFYLDQELLELMHKSGCQYIDIAIESGVERVERDIVHKPIDYNHAKKMVKLAKELGIYVCANFMVGFPGETWDEILQTISFAEELDVDYIKLYATMPLEHTELYRIAKEGGYLKDNFSREKLSWSQGQIQTSEFTTRDLSVLRAYEWDRINFTDPVKRKRTAQMMGVTEEELKKIRRDTLNSVKV